ncbi:MAG: hypothetical protein ACRDPY_13880 [Streptosporangiaceae bacterium]
MIGSRTEAEAYMRVAAERYRLIRTHEWKRRDHRAPAAKGQVAAGGESA